MRVLAVSSYGVLAGAELSLAEFLAHRPEGIEAAALLVEDGPLRDRLAGLGLDVYAAHGYDGRPDPRRMLRFTRELLPLLRRERPDVVWATGLKAATMAVPACRLLGIPVVWHKVDFSLDGSVTKPLGAAVNAVVGVSNAVTEALGPLRARRVLGVVGPPVRLPADATVSPASKPLAIGTMGRLVPFKGHEHIIRAGAALSAEFPDLRVILAGDASPDFPGERGRLRDLGDELGLSERLEMPGFTPDVLGVLRRLTVFVTATYRDEQGFGWEGLSGAMLEASWVGLPLVAARGGGTAEGLHDGVTGTLVQRADGALIADAAGAYLRDPALAVSTGEAGRAFAREHFAPEGAARRLFALLGEAAGARS
ncbi:MAG: epsJ 2 [Solirubrobacteraceae bacterium]|nr:epsJ 2 [Solirubrobacteraceae bacterium]